MAHFYKECLKLHIFTHPDLNSQDVIKFCFQAAFGAEHMLGDVKSVREYFFCEYDKTKESDIALFEALNDEYGRVNFAAWKKRKYDPEALLKLFVDSATSVKREDKTKIVGFLDAAGEVLEEAGCKITPSEWKKSRDNYLNSGISAVHHSDIYRKLYNPAYRVVKVEMYEYILRDFLKEKNNENQ